MTYDGGTMSSAKNVVESLREIVQDFLVPELKALKVSVESLQHEMKSSNEALRQELRLRDEMMLQSIKNLSDKLDYTGEIRERLAAVEARLPRQ